MEYERRYKEKFPVLAICYDFDKTLSPDDMQAQGYIQSIDYEVGDFWKESNQLATDNNMDRNLVYMLMMVNKARGKVLFTREEYERELSDLSKGVVRLIKNETDYWFDNNWDEYGIPGYYNWDAIAAAYMMHPELFETQIVDMQLSTEKLTKGRMILAEDEAKKNCTLKIPVIRDEDEFRRNLYDTWMNVEIETVK